MSMSAYGASVHHDDICRDDSAWSPLASKREFDDRCATLEGDDDSANLDDGSTLCDSEEGDCMFSLSLTSVDLVRDRNILQDCGPKLSFVPRDAPVTREHMTTLRLTNIPQVYTIDALVQLLEAHNVKGFDFISLSFDHQTCVCSGHATINFCSHHEAKNAMVALSGVSKWQAAGRQKALGVSWSVLQGLQANVAHYKATEDIMIPEAFKAVVLNNGRLVCA